MGEAGARPVRIRTEDIELGVFLKLARAFPTGGMAKLAVQEGRVRVNGQVERRRARRLRPGDRVEVDGTRLLVAREEGEGGGVGEERPHP